MVRPSWLVGWANRARLGASPWLVGDRHPACRHLHMPGVAADGIVSGCPAADAATGEFVSGFARGQGHRVGLCRGLARGWLLALGFPSHTLVRATVAKKSMRARCRKN